jgi:hypothetical protein
MKNYFILMLLALFACFSNDTYAQDVKARTGATKVETPAVPQHALVQVQPVDPTPNTVVLESSPAVTVDYSSPDSFFTEGFIGALKAALLALISALGAFIPGLRNIAAKKGGKAFTSAVVGSLALITLLLFKGEALTEHFFSTIMGFVLPGVAYSGIVYNLFKMIVGLIKKKPPTAPASAT